MPILIRLYVLLNIYAVKWSSGQLSDDPDELLNWCIVGRNHKERPSAEDELHGSCIPWKNWACCTHNVTRIVHTTTMYNFNWNHCGQTKNMSSKCMRHFIQDLCFYECEPNLGPWVVKVNMKIRKERYYKVPICASDCDTWFNDCRDDYTCVDNWTTKFVFIKGENRCPSSSVCIKYSEMFRDAKHFCELIWDDSWKYTPDNEPCMRLWFNGSLGNPNARVAQVRVQELMAIKNIYPAGVANFAILIFCLFISCINILQ